MSDDLSQFLNEQYPTAQPDPLEKTALDVASHQDPDVFAKMRETALAIGTDTTFVENDPQTAQQLAKAKRNAAALGQLHDTPKTKQFLQKYDHAALAQDDVINMGKLERSLRLGGIIGDNVAAAPINTMSGIYGAGETASRFVQQHLTKPLATAAKSVFGYDKVADPFDAVTEFFSVMHQGTANDQKELTARNESLGFVGSSVMGGVQSSFQSLGTLAGFAAMGRPDLALDAFFLTTFGNASADAVNKGVPLDQAVVYGIAQGGIEKATEMIAIKPLVDMLNNKTGFGKQLALFLGKDMLGEQVATFTQDLNDWAVLPENADKTVGDFWDSRDDAAARTFIASLVGAGIQSGALKTAGMAIDKIHRHANRDIRERAADGVAAISAKVRLDQAAELAKSSKLNKRSQSLFRDFVQHLDPQDNAVHLSADDAATFFQSNPEVAAAVQKDAPDVFASMSVAQATGGDVKIPVSVYLANFSEYHDQLGDKLRVGNNRQSFAEYQQSASAIESEIASLARSTIEGKPAEHRSQVAAIGSEFRNMLKKTRRFSDDVTNKYATLFEHITGTLAERTGMSPQEFAQKYRLIPTVPGKAVPQQVKSTVDDVDVVINRLRANDYPTDAEQFGDSLVDFIRSKGGIKDDGGELKARDARSATAKAFAKGFVKDDGMHPDKAAEIAYEAGYIDSRDMDSLLSAIDDELAGSPVYAAQNDNPIAQDQARMMSDVAQTLRDKDLAKLSNAEIKTLLFGDPNDPFAGHPMPATPNKDEPLPFFQGATFNQTGLIDLAALPDSMADAVTHTSLYYLQGKENSPERKDYLDAKEKGDIDAAFRTVDRVFKSKQIDAIKSMLDPQKKIFVIPVHQQEDEEVNALPVAYANRIAVALGGNVVESIVKSGGTKNTGKKQVDRLHDTHEYEGEIPDADGQYIIVDDNFTSGSTITPLIDMVQKAGGDMRVVSTLAASKYGYGIKPHADKLEKLRSDTGLTDEALKSIIGHDPKNLTNAQLGIVLNATRTGGEEALRRIFASKGEEGTPGGTGIYGDGEGSEKQAGLKNPANSTFNQQSLSDVRGSITFPDSDITQAASILTINENADLSTVLHELGHFYFETLLHIANNHDSIETDPIRADVQTLLEFGGVQTLAEWNALTIEERRATHEKVAESFERYLMEGKAPTVSMRDLFRTFRAWLMNVYASFSRAPGRELNDDVRAVFDRLIATDEEIEIVRRQNLIVDMFGSAEFAGMSEDDYNTYINEFQGQTDSAKEKLGMRALKDLQWQDKAVTKEIKKLQADNKQKASSMKDEVTADLAAYDKTYRAWYYFSKGKIPEDLQETITGAVKLDSGTLQLMYGKEADALWRQLPRNMRGQKNSIHPDVIAPIFGFESGDALVRALATARDPAEVIKDEVNKRLLERYGDINSDERLHDEAVALLHDKTRVKTIQREYIALNELAKQPNRLTAADARDYAENAISKMKIADINPHSYLMAERKAGRLAMDAFGKHNVAEAARQKHIQLIQSALYSAARNADIERSSAITHLKWLSKLEARKSIDGEYLQQIRALLERYDLRQNVSIKELAKRQSLAIWIKRQQEMGFNPDFTEASITPPKHYKEMTMEELRGLRDQARQIEHFGRMKKNLLLAAEARDFNKHADKMVASIIKFSKRKPQQRKEPINKRRIEESRKRSVSQLFYGHRKFSSIIRQLDGYKDGGIMWRTFLKTANERNTMEVEAMTKAGETLQRLFTPYTSLGDNIKRASRAATLGFSPLRSKLDQKVMIDGVGSLTLEERLSVALNMGSSVNVDRLREGGLPSAGPLSDIEMERITDTLDQADWDFVKGVWAAMEEKWPAMAEMEERLSGIAPEKKQTIPVRTRFGTIPGGYYPISYADRTATKQTIDDLLNDHKKAVYMKAQTKQGHLKETAEFVKRPLRTDLGVVSEHFAQVNHDLAWREWGIDAGRLIRDDRIISAISENYSDEMLDEIEAVINDIITGDIPAMNAFEGVLQHVRSGVSISTMGMSVTTALVQPLGLTQSIVRIGARHMAAGLKEYLSGPVAMQNKVKEVFAKSALMKSRETTMTREINDVISEAIKNGSISWLKRNYFWLIQKTQMYGVDMPTWLGAHSKALNEGFSESDAIALADQSVLDAQTGGNIKDLARVQRGSPAMKLFTNFYSYFNGTFNMTAESYHKTDFSKLGDVGHLVSDMLLLYTIPALLGVAVFSALRGDDDSEDEIWKQIVLPQVAYLMNTMILIRELSGAVGGFGYHGPAGTGFFKAGTDLMTQAGQGEADVALAKAAARTASIAFHFPVSQLIRTIEGMDAYSKGEAPITSVAVGKPQNF